MDIKQHQFVETHTLFPDNLNVTYIEAYYDKHFRWELNLEE